MIWYHTTSNHIRRHQTAMSTYYYDKCQHMPYHLSVSFLYQCSFIYFDHILPLLYFTLLYFTLLYFTFWPFPLFSFSTLYPFYILFINIWIFFSTIINFFHPILLSMKMSTSLHQYFSLSISILCTKYFFRLYII